MSWWKRFQSLISHSIFHSIQYDAQEAMKMNRLRVEHYVPSVHFHDPFVVWCKHILSIPIEKLPVERIEMGCNAGAMVSSKDQQIDVLYIVREDCDIFLVIEAWRY